MQKETTTPELAKSKSADVLLVSARHYYLCL